METAGGQWNSSMFNRSLFGLILISSRFQLGVSTGITCGVDKSTARRVYEGTADIKDYPWMGTFKYRKNSLEITTAVVLITKQFVLGSASEIDNVPKYDFRERSSVVLGKSCQKNGIQIVDYTFHPDYKQNAENFLVILQLDVDNVKGTELRPVCPPPVYFTTPDFYSMTTSNYNCKKGKIHIRKMEFVDTERCRQFYRRSGMDVGRFWPSHAVCARALSGGKCRLRSGTALLIKQEGHWRFLGFGLSGPGCQLPTRFLDYGMHESWVRQTVARIGKPSITRLAENHLIMRRSLSNVQRFGPCDLEETKYEIYSDQTEIRSTVLTGKATYNVTLIHQVEYSCIVFRADYEEEHKIVPSIYLRRWYGGPPQICYDYDLLEIQFFVEIGFLYNTNFKMVAYGKIAKAIEPKRSMRIANNDISPPEVPEYKALSAKLLKLFKASNNSISDIGYRWFLKSDEDSNRNPREDVDYKKTLEPNRVNATNVTRT